MANKIKKMFGRRILVELSTSFQELTNGIRLKKEVQSRRELVSGRVIKVSEIAEDMGVDVGDVVVFPFYSANEADRRGKNFVTIDANDLEWSEDYGS